MVIQCSKCKSEYYYTLERCPHCAYPGNYSNVLVAAGTNELDAVERRYDKAVSGAAKRGCAPQFAEFTAALEASHVVLARPFADVDRLASGANSVQATYYDLIDAGLLLPDGSLWEQLRKPADEVLFPSYREKIRFGALSTDGIGVINYGHFWMTMRLPFIEDRTSVFDQNSVTFVSEKKLKTASNALVGHRTPWSNRSKLAAAQLADRIGPATKKDDFASILIRQGATTADDRFIETHTWGSITVLTIESVRFQFDRVRKVAPRSLLKNLSRSLTKYGATLVEVP